MPIIGFSFDKINATRAKPLSGKINIKQDVRITSVEKDTVNLVQSEDTVKFGFSFSLNYEPNLGNIDLTGHILYLTGSKDAESLIKKWSKDKKLDDERLLLSLLNTVIAKSSVKALTLAQEVNLPPHLKLPRVASKPKKN